MSTTPDKNDPLPDDLDTDTPDVIDLGAADDGDLGGISAAEHRKVTDQRDAALRQLADVENMRKRLHAEKDMAVQFANQSLIKSLIPVIDNFERALAVDPAKTDSAAVLKGLQLVHDTMMAELKKQAVEVIDPKPGDAFDPTKHEALMQQEKAGAKPNTIVQALTRGYAIHGRTLRPAGVMVAK
ncbi:MAG: nucleotide exchange factor GrpE [Phycisphaerae bacterium]|nr:nucleotide exchange factor GrpE [Tepidisphaeraceae bacterium]